jgi:hypothetical protein
MHIQTINYQKTFNLGNYSSERIGVEIAINAGEDAKEALQTAKEFVEEFHKEKNIKEPEFFPYEEPVQIIKTQSPKTLSEKTIHEINQCKDETQLKAWKFMAAKYPDVMEVYNAKLKLLKK